MRQRKPLEAAELFRRAGEEGYRPLISWCWNDGPEPREVRRQVRAFVQAGMGGFCIVPGAGQPHAISGDAWLDALEAAIDEAKRTGLTVWLHGSHPRRMDGEQSA